MDDQPVVETLHDQPDEDAARAKALNDPMRLVLAGKWTPRQADEAWETMDVLPYLKVLPGGLPTLAWSLPLAVAWIATRRRDLTERAALRAQFWGDRIAQEPAEQGWVTDLGTAAERLRAALMWGKVTALGRRADEENSREMPAGAWAGLVIGLSMGSVALNHGLRGLAPAVWHDVQLSPDEVARMWPAASLDNPAADVAPATDNKVELQAPFNLSAEEGLSRQHEPASAEPPLETLSSPPEVAPAPTGRPHLRAAKASAIGRARFLIANAPGGMRRFELTAYVKKHEPLLSRADVDGLKYLYPELRRPGDNARTLASRKPPK